VLQQASYLAQSTNVNYSWYANTTFDVTDQFDLLGGVRFNKQKISYDFDNYNVHPNAHFDGANQENSVTVRAVSSTSGTPDIMTFATYSTGYKGQAYDLVSTFTAKTAAQMPVAARNREELRSRREKQPVRSSRVPQSGLFHTDFNGFQTFRHQHAAGWHFLTFLNSVGKLRTRAWNWTARRK